MARKKAAAHHGGAWKVAYADFVTAMMALFMVLWISSQDKEVLIATSRYFQTPFKSPLDAKSGLLNFESNKPASSSGGEKSATDPAGGKSTKSQNIDLQFLNSVAKDVYRLLNLDEALADKPIDVQVTSDGLRITLFDRAHQPLFEERTAKFTPWGNFVMQSLAWMIDRNDFHVVIEGHTRAGLSLPSPDYTPWELSADRANATRRSLTRYAVAERLIERVTGYADTRPVPLTAPDSESNQRVTLSLRLGDDHGKKPAKPARPLPPATKNSPPAKFTAPSNRPAPPPAAPQTTPPSSP
ncbi:MAG: flagellar motor protein MotB [Opitutaceae bacterium]|jgi:chemotaxis protein MotB